MLEDKVAVCAQGTNGQNSYCQGTKASPARKRGLSTDGLTRHSWSSQSSTSILVVTYIIGVSKQATYFYTDVFLLLEWAPN
jgi:hypothetical protein